MKCPICGKNAWLHLDGNALMYKCLDEKCGNITEKEVTTKNTSNIKLREDREHIKNVAKSNTKSILVSNIKKIRNDIGLNQGEVSQALGLSGQRYGTIERCDNIPTISKLMDLCNIYNVTFNDLFTITFLSEEQYKVLNRLVVKDKNASNNDENDRSVILEEDMKIDELEKKIVAYEEKTSVTERKIFNNDTNKDTPELIKIKNNLKKLDSDLTTYRKKNNAILKQGTVIDYYYWTVAKEIIGYDTDR